MTSQNGLQKKCLNGSKCNYHDILRERERVEREQRVESREQRERASERERVRERERPHTHTHHSLSPLSLPLLPPSLFSLPPSILLSTPVSPARPPFLPTSPHLTLPHPSRTSLTDKARIIAWQFVSSRSTNFQKSVALKGGVESKLAPSFRSISANEI